MKILQIFNHLNYLQIIIYNKIFIKKVNFKYFINFKEIQKNKYKESYQKSELPHNTSSIQPINSQIQSGGIEKINSNIFPKVKF